MFQIVHLIAGGPKTSQNNCEGQFKHMNMNARVPSTRLMRAYITVTVSIRQAEELSLCYGGPTKESALCHSIVESCNQQSIWGE